MSEAPDKPAILAAPESASGFRHWMARNAWRLVLLFGGVLLPLAGFVALADEVGEVWAEGAVEDGVRAGLGEGGGGGAEAEALNPGFFKRMRTAFPQVTVKLGASLDGRTAMANGDSKWISGAQSRQLVHQWRAEEQAILVGKNTALHDNPRLNVRDWTGSDPIRVVLDSQLELPADLHLFDQQIPTLCYNLLKSEKLTNLEWVQLPQLSLEALLADLHARQIQSVLIEGGSQTITQFLAAGLWDEARVFTAPIEFERGIAAPQLTQTPAESHAIGEDQLDIYYHG